MKGMLKWKIYLLEFMYWSWKWTNYWKGNFLPKTLKYISTVYFYFALMKILSKVMSKGTLRANWPILTSDHYTKPLTSMWSNLVTTCNKARNWWPIHKIRERKGLLQVMGWFKGKVGFLWPINQQGYLSCP